MPPTVSGRDRSPRRPRPTIPASLTRAGTNVDGDRVIHHVEVSTFQNFVGTDLVRTFALEGNRSDLDHPAPCLFGGAPALAHSSGSEPEHHRWREPFRSERRDRCRTRPGPVAWSRLTQSQVEEAGQVLARAFQNDPLLAYLEPNEANGDVRFLGSWPIRPASAAFGPGLHNRRPVEGVAIWVPPGRPTLRQKLSAGLSAAPLRAGLGATLRFLKFASYESDFHHRHFPPLLVPGVAGGRPASQGRASAPASSRPAWPGGHRQSAHLPRDLHRSGPRLLPEARLRGSDGR